MTEDDVRRLALALPEATEEPHFDAASFRVRSRIFASLPAGGGIVEILVTGPDVKEAIAEQPGSCQELLSGRKLLGVRVRLAEADPVLVKELLSLAWRRRAPQRLSSQWD